nr:hypothetical protein [Tanacetum cinerariifolium]
MVAPDTSATAPIISSAAPVVEMIIVASPTGLCGLVPYSDLDFDSPDEMASSEVTTRSTSPSDFPIAPVTAPLKTRRQASSLIRPGEAIPLGRPYRTRPNRLQRVMTARKRVGPLPAYRLAWRHVSPHSLDHHPSSSSSPTNSLPVHSSGLDAPDQAHSRYLTRVVSPRLGYPPSSSRDSSERLMHSSSHSAGPSRKRCRSSANSVPSSTPVTGSLAPTRVDLLPPRKRFRDSYSSEAIMEEDTKVDPTETKVDMKLGTGDGDDVIDYKSKKPAGEDSSDSSGTKDGIVRSLEDMLIDLDDVVHDFYHHMFEVRIDRIVEIETVQRRLVADQLISSEERARMIKRIESLRSENLKIRDDHDDLRRRTMTNTRSGMTPHVIKEMINRRVVEALEAHEINRNIGLQNLNGNCNDGNGNGNGNVGNVNFKRTEGVVGLIRWCEKMEIVNEIQKMETELWNLTVKNNDLATYTKRFQELTMMCTKMVPEEEDRVEMFIKGLPDNIQGSVMATKLTRLQDVVRIAKNMMDKKLKGYANIRGQNVARAYTTGNNETRGYVGTLPYHNRCKLHHEGQCTMKCSNCKRVRHKTRDCRSVIAATTQGTPGPNQKVNTCFECGAPGHYHKDCPKIKNQNRGNKARIPEAKGKAYVLRGGDANPDSNTSQMKNAYRTIVNCVL